MGESALTTGAVVGEYRLIRKLGEGGMGEVYLAHDVRLRREVALKALKREYAADPERRKRFMNEARAAAALAHGGVAAVHDLKECGEHLFIVFEYVDGANLRSLVQPGGMDLEELLDMAVQIAAALEAAHARGIVHRDLKPENVMRRPTGEVKVLDFGLARMDAGILPTSSTTQSALTHTGMVAGTIAYMSPEQMRGQPTDFRSDIFSFGVMLYELTTGTRPFAGETFASVIANVLTAEPPPLGTASPLYGPELDRIVRKCLRKVPDERYQSTRDLLVDLKNLKRASGEARPTAPGRHAVRIRTPQNWWVMHSSSYLIVGIPMLAYIGWQLRELAPPFGRFVFLAQALLLALEAWFRVVGLVVWGLNHKELRAAWERVRRPLLCAGFGIAATILTQTAMLVSKDELGRAALMGMLAMAAISAVFIEPAIVPHAGTSNSN